VGRLQAIYLAKWLDEEFHDTRAFKETRDKFGHSFETFPYEGDDPLTKGGSVYKSTWGGDPEQAKKYYKRKAKLYQKDYEQKRDRFYKLIKENIKVWWD